MNRASTTPQSQESAESVPPVEEPKPVGGSPSEPAPYDDLAEVKKDLAKAEKKMSGFETSTLRWTRASFIVIFFTGLFIALQWLEMRGGGKDTHDLAVAAKDQVDKMKNMSEAADKIRQAAENMVTQEQRIADQAGKSLNASINTSRNDQRAWLGIWVAHIYPIDGNSKIRTEVEIVNTGKTPAIHVRQAASRFIWRQPLLPGPTSNIVKGFRFTPGAPIPPQGKMTISAEESVAAIGEDYSGMKGGTKIFYLAGEVRYDDVFGRHHKTQFCLYRAHPDDQVLTACQEFHGMN